jgi:PHD/YefM family antitoxin component YafN of YafNO toxin-antitoxin module
MSRAISQEELIPDGSELAKVLGQETVLVQKDGETVAVIVSPSEYESTREARAKRAIEAMMAFRQHMHSVATPAELEELERELDRKAC